MKKPIRAKAFLKGRWKTPAALAAVALLGYWIATRPATKTQDWALESRPASDFALPDLSGRTVRLSDFKGKVVLVDFWATWCLPCLEELPGLKALHLKYRDRGFTLVGISIDHLGKEVVGPFVRDNEVPYPILLAGLYPVEGFPVRGLPTAYLIDREGRFVKRYFGYKFPEELEQDVAEYLNGGSRGTH